MAKFEIFASCHDHSTFSDPRYDRPHKHSGVTEEDFMTIYERRLG